MRWRGTLVLAVGLLLAADAPERGKARTDRQKMQGTWRLTALVIDGKMVPPERIQEEHTLVVKGDRFVSKFSDEPPHKGTFTLDPDANPRTVDFTVTEGRYKGKTLRGIYELTDSTLKACYGAPGKERPKDFTAGPGKWLYTYKRARNSAK